MAEDRVRADVDSWVDVYPYMKQLAQDIQNSEFIPGAKYNSKGKLVDPGMRGRWPDILAAFINAREAGMPLLTGLRSVQMIHGNPSWPAAVARALALAAGHRIVVDEMSDARVIMRGARAGQTEWSPQFIWTIDQARKRQIRNVDQHPRQSLFARCSAELVRALFPEVLYGFGYTTEELEDIGPEGASTPAPAAPKPRPVQRKSKSKGESKGEGSPQRESEAPKDVEGTQTPPPPVETPPEGAADDDLPPLPEEVEAPAPSSHPTAGRSDEPPTEAQRGKIFAIFRHEAETREDRLAIATKLLTRDEGGEVIRKAIKSFSDITKDDASRMIDHIDVAEKSNTPLAKYADDWDSMFAPQGAERGKG